MIRTKDLVLFVVALIFLTVAIVFTLARSQSGNETNDDSIHFSEANPPIELSATYEEKVLDRSSIIARLREALAKDHTVSSKPVEVAEETDMDETATQTTNTNEVTLNKCSDEKDAINFSRNWPRENVSVQVAEGVRAVSEIVTTLPITTASGTLPTPSISVRPLATLPLVPTLAEPSCLASEIIGVTIDGSLIFNSDAIAYYNRSSDYLIGFARDGVPIYGSYSGQTDSCGGYMSGSGYRYSVSPDRNFIIGCYMGLPNSFVGE